MKESRMTKTIPTIRTKHMRTNPVTITQIKHTHRVTHIQTVHKLAGTMDKTGVIIIMQTALHTLGHRIILRLEMSGTTTTITATQNSYNDNNSGAAQNNSQSNRAQPPNSNQPNDPSSARFPYNNASRQFANNYADRTRVNPTSDRTNPNRVGANLVDQDPGNDDELEDRTNEDAAVDPELQSEGENEDVEEYEDGYLPHLDNDENPDTNYVTINQVESVGNTTKAKRLKLNSVETHVKGKETYYQVPSVLDSGATHSIASVHTMGKAIGKIVPTNKEEARTAGGTTYPIIGQTFVRLKIVTPRRKVISL